MIIFNTSYQVEDSIEKEWLGWMKETFIPLFMDTGIFTDYKFCKVMVDDVTYSLQLFLRDMGRFNEYEAEYANKFNSVLVSKYGNKILTFSALLKEI